MTVVDASVLVSAFYPADVFHITSSNWLRRQIRAGQLLLAPTLLQAEVAGAIARRTQEPDRAYRAVRWIRALPELELVTIDDGLGALAAELAIELKLRGADAVYVALAVERGLPFYTWDREQRERTARVVDAREPT